MSESGQIENQKLLMEPPCPPICFVPGPVAASPGRRWQALGATDLRLFETFLTASAHASGAQMGATGRPAAFDEAACRAVGRLHHRACI